MRFSTKSGLAFLAVIVVVLGAVALWMERELRNVSDDMLSDTAQLVGREIAAALTEPMLQQLRNSDPAATTNLMSMVEDVTARSQMVSAVLVADASGTVIAGTSGSRGRRVAMPKVIFDENPRPRFIVNPTAAEQDRLLLFVPLLGEGHVEGYIRLSLKSDRLARLYGRARRDLLVVGGISILAIAILSFVLNQQLARLGGALAGALYGVIRGEPVRLPRGGEEFSPAFAAVEAVGQELSLARERGAQAQRRLSSLMQVMDVGVLLLGPQYTLDFANQHARKLLGGGNVDGWQHGWEQVRAALEPALKATKAGASHLDVDLPNQSTHGQLRLEIYRLAEDDCEGHLVLVKSRDTIEALENELRLAVQMRGFAHFYMAFAHDLKAPLNAMVMNLDLLGQTIRRGNGADPNERERQQQYIDVLRGEIARLDRDLQTLLHHVVVPENKIQEFDLREVLTDVAALLGPLAKHQRVTFQTQLPDSTVALSGHRDRLKQALLNIVINALEAMPQGGRLAMELQQGNGKACIAVADSGPGIPPDLLDEIYKMHFTTKAGGSGIGLYVARSVVEAHGGQIAVESAPGRGTRFELEIPLDPIRA